jgi:hypothetical protein
LRPHRGLGQMEHRRPKMGAWSTGSARKEESQLGRERRGDTLRRWIGCEIQYLRIWMDLEQWDA